MPKLRDFVDAQKRLPAVLPGRLVLDLSTPLFDNAAILIF